jgi:hypothetical protein
VSVSERDRQRHQGADDAARKDGEEQVVHRDGPDSPAAWAVELLIAAAIGVVMFLVGTWTAAVLGGVTLGVAAVLRVYAVRLKHRRGQGTRPPE